MITLLDATTSADQSKEFAVARDRRPAQFTARGLAGAEEVTIQKKEDDGNFYDFYLDNVKQVITATHSGVTVYGPGTYRGDKDSTAAAVPVAVAWDYSP